jgi:hypothetical protein
MPALRLRQGTAGLPNSAKARPGGSRIQHICRVCDKSRRAGPSEEMCPHCYLSESQFSGVVRAPEVVFEFFQMLSVGSKFQVHYVA